MTVLLGASITVLVGLELGEPLGDWLRRVAFLLSALITALASIEAFYDPRGQHVRSMATYLQLLQLRAGYQFGMAPPTEETAEAIVNKEWDRLQIILSQEHAQRMEALQHQNEQKDSKAA